VDVLSNILLDRRLKRHRCIKQPDLEPLGSRAAFIKSSTLIEAGQQLLTRLRLSDVLAPAASSDGSTDEAMSTSSQEADQAKPYPKLITQADYIAADIMNRDNIEQAIHELEGVNAPDDDATSAVLQMHQKTLFIRGQALDHSSPVVSLNLQCLAEGMFRMESDIDDNHTIQYTEDPDYERVEDPGVDVEASKAAKLRFVKFMEDEAMILGNKDMENFLLWAGSFVGWMSHCFEGTKLAIENQLSSPGGFGTYKVGWWRETRIAKEKKTRKLNYYFV
jgi:hypothetical protein